MNPPPETQKHTCFSVSVCEGGSALSAPVATFPPVSQDRMKHVLPTPPGSLRGAGGRSVRFAFVRLLIGVSRLSLCCNPTSQVTSPFGWGGVKGRRYGRMGGDLEVITRLSNQEEVIWSQAVPVDISPPAKQQHPPTSGSQRRVKLSSETSRIWG